MLQWIIILSLFLASFITFVYLIYKKKVRIILLGKPINRFNNPLERIKGLFIYVLLQRNLFKEWFAGLIHALIFWGFLTFSIGYAFLFITGRELGDLFGGTFLSPLVNIYALVTNIFGVLVILSVFIALYRRHILKIKRLELSFDATLILLWIFFIMISNFLTDGIRLRLHHSPEEAVSFLSNLFSSPFANLSNEALQVPYTIFF